MVFKNCAGWVNLQSDIRVLLLFAFMYYFHSSTCFPTEFTKPIFLFHNSENIETHSKLVQSSFETVRNSFKLEIAEYTFCPKNVQHMQLTYIMGLTYNCTHMNLHKCKLSISIFCCTAYIRCLVNLIPWYIFEEDKKFVLCLRSILPCGLDFFVPFFQKSQIEFWFSGFDYCGLRSFLSCWTHHLIPYLINSGVRFALGQFTAHPIWLLGQSWNARIVL